MAKLHPDRAIELVARGQAGVFSLGQARTAGFTNRMVDARLRVGRWLRLTAGVYALPSHEGTFLRQCWAAVLAEPNSAIGGLAAAALWRLGSARPGRPELVVPPTGSARNPIARVHRYAHPKITTLRRLPITTISQTVFDIAGRSTHDEMEGVLDGALLGRQTTVADLDERLAAYQGTRRAGLPLMRSLLDDRRAEGWAPTESELERVLGKCLRGLPGDGRLLRQHPFPWRDARPGRVDFWLPGYNTLLEADGRRWHARLHDFDKDRWRDNLAVTHGVRSLRFTWVHLVERPSEVRELVIAVGSRAA